MYPVSEEYKKAISESSRSFFWTGEITTKQGKIYAFDNKDIVKGSGYISRQCSGSSEIELGSVYAAEMGISLFSDIDRYSLEDAVITLSFHLKVDGGAYEEVPMGVFYVAEANRKIKTLELKAYDAMLNLEKNFNKGLSVLTGLTGGYIIAWPVMTILCGIQPKTQNTKLNVALNIILSLVGLAVCESVGALQWALLSGSDLNGIIIYSLTAFVPKDIILTVLAVLIGRQVRKMASKAGGL